MVPGVVKAAVAGALHWTRADALIGALTGSKRLPLVITYHRVVEHFAADAEESIPAMLVSCRMLERHLDWIGRRFRFVALDELGRALEERSSFDGPMAAITFDDGYRDVYDNAVPLLKRKGIPAAVFVVTELIGARRGLVPDELYLLLRRAWSAWRSPSRDLPGMLRELGTSVPALEGPHTTTLTPLAAMRALLNALPQATLNRVIAALDAELAPDADARISLRPLTWEMLCDLHRAGFTIGSHTRTHALLPNESPHRVVEETRGSREDLEQKLGITVRHFAYPNGWFNTAVVRAVAAAGYRFGYTTCRHHDPAYPLLTVPRIVLWEHSSLDPLGRHSAAIMSCQINRVFDLVAGCRQDHAP